MFVDDLLVDVEVPKQKVFDGEHLVFGGVDSLHALVEPVGVVRLGLTFGELFALLIGFDLLKR